MRDIQHLVSKYAKWHLSFTKGKWKLRIYVDIIWTILYLSTCCIRISRHCIFVHNAITDIIITGFNGSVTEYIHIIIWFVIIIILFMHYTICTMIFCLFFYKQILCFHSQYYLHFLNMLHQLVHWHLYTNHCFVKDNAQLSTQSLVIYFFRPSVHLLLLNLFQLHNAVHILW